MIEGALILLSGMAIGWALASFPKNKPKETEVPTEQPYDKYKNGDGLYSRKVVKGSR